MVPAPAPRIGNVHLIAQHVPYHPGLLPRFQCLDRRHAVQSIEHLIASKGTTITTSKHLFE